MGILHGKNPKSTQKNQILICGYYNRHNYGDDVFVDVLSRQWKEHTLVFKNLETVEPDDVKAADLIVLGGGDLLQEYFITRIEQRILPYKNCPIYAVGVSMPFASVLEYGRLDMIDQFWCRFRSDVKTLEARFGVGNVHYIPDLALLSPLPTRKLFKERKKIGLCLSMSLARGFQEIIIPQIRNLVERLLVMGFEPHWLAFNDEAGADGAHESDVALYNLLPLGTRRHLFLHHGPQLIPALVEMDILIASRFHAHVFGYLAGIPTISLVLTRKVEQWNLDHGWEKNAIILPRKCQYCCDPTNAQESCPGCVSYMGYPTSLPVNEITNKVRLGYKPVYNVRKDIILLENILTGVIDGEWPHRATPPYFLPRNRVEQYHNELQPQWQSFIEGKHTAEFFASVVCLKLTGNPTHPYHYGLVENLKTQGVNFKLLNALDYMVKTHYRQDKRWQNGLQSNPDGLFSLTKVPQNRLEGIHRSGWEYVTDLLASFHKTDGLLFDSFTDKTFGWHSEYLEALGVIPYRETWIGVLHHPARAVFSSNDCEHLFTKRSFLDSLPTCRGLVVMATDLKLWLENKLREYNFEVPVHMIYHPTEVPDIKFRWKRFTANKQPKVVQVGAWLRDPYGIFQLHVPSLTKAVLKCKDIEGYLTAGPPKVIESVISPVMRAGGCRDGPGSTPFISSVQQVLNEQWNSVEVINHLSNIDYDLLLSENVVFLPLLEAVAVNTVLECIARNTPLIVSKLPAVVEYLGEDYPLYFENYAEAERKLADRGLLRAGYKYLKKMNKDHVSVERFLESIQETLAN